MRRTKEDAAKTRRQLLEAAAQVFYEKGVGTATLEQIAARCGVSRGALYWHFKDKADLLEALIADIRLPQEELVAQGMGDAQLPCDALSVLEASSLCALKMLEEDMHQQRIFAILMVNCENQGKISDVMSRMNEANQQLYQDLESKFHLARAGGLLAENWTAEMAARAFYCTLNGLFAEWVRTGRAFPLSEVGCKLVAALVSSFRGEGGQSA